MPVQVPVTVSRFQSYYRHGLRGTVTVTVCVFVLGNRHWFNRFPGLVTGDEPGDVCRDHHDCHGFQKSSSCCLLNLFKYVVVYYYSTQYKAVRVGGGGQWRTCAKRYDEPTRASRCVSVNPIPNPDPNPNQAP
jgi:hypothetical protein